MSKTSFTLYFPLFRTFGYIYLLPKDIQTLVGKFLTEDQIYKDLQTLNPNFSYDQWSYSEYDKCGKFDGNDLENDDQLYSRLIHPLDDYYESISAIMRASVIYRVHQTTGMIEFYDIYFNCLRPDQQIATNSCLDYLGPDYDLSNTDAYEKFASFITPFPRGLTVIDCRGDKCRRSIDYEETGIWCTACRGESADMRNLIGYFHKNIWFNDIPIDHIIYLKRRIEKINDSNRKDVDRWIKGHNEKISSLRNYIDNHDQFVAKQNQVMQEKKREAQQELNLYLSLLNPG